MRSFDFEGVLGGVVAVVVVGLHVVGTRFAEAVVSENVLIWIHISSTLIWF